MYRVLILLALLISFTSVTVFSQRDSGRHPVERRDPPERRGSGDEGGGGQKTAQPKPAVPRENLSGISDNGRERPVGHPERPSPRPNPPLQERPVPEPDPEPCPDPEPNPNPYLVMFCGCYDCPDDPYYPDEPYYPYPSEEPTLKMKAIDAFESKNFLRALSLLTDAINETPYDYELYFYRGVTNVKLDNYLWAIEDLNIYLHKYPTNKVAWYYRGLAYYYSYNDEEAYTNLEFAVKLGEPRAKIFLTRYY